MTTRLRVTARPNPLPSHLPRDVLPLSFQHKYQILASTDALRLVEKHRPRKSTVTSIGRCSSDREVLLQAQSWA